MTVDGDQPAASEQRLWIMLAVVHSHPIDQVLRASGPAPDPRDWGRA
jgi:hypothetical protein